MAFFGRLVKSTGTFGLGVSVHFVFEPERFGTLIKCLHVMRKFIKSEVEIRRRVMIRASVGRESRLGGVIFSGQE